MVGAYDGECRPKQFQLLHCQKSTALHADSFQNKENIPFERCIRAHTFKTVPLHRLCLLAPPLKRQEISKFPNSFCMEFRGNGQFFLGNRRETEISISLLGNCRGKCPFPLRTFEHRPAYLILTIV